MKVLQFHNRQLAFGGADAVISNERAALQSAGHQVATVEADTGALLEKPVGKLRAVAAATWNLSATARLSAAIADFQPDVVHFHEVYPVASPAVVRTARRHNVPAVMTHHSYRAACPSTALVRNGSTCTDCVGRAVKSPAVINRCYHDSIAGSATIAASMAFHTMARTVDGIDVHIALSEFGRDILQAEWHRIAGNGPDKNIVVAPNFLPHAGPPDTGRPRQPSIPTEQRLLFIGRLRPEKGIEVFAREAGASQVPLTIAGSGPLDLRLRALADTTADINVLGPVPHDAVPELIDSHAAVVLPSQWHEACPMSIIEAFARNRPVLVPDNQQFAAMVEPGVTGEHFAPGDPGVAARQIIERSMAGRYPSIRAHFDTVYSEKAGVLRLEEVYRSAVDHHRATRKDNP